MEKKELEEKLRGLVIFTEGDGQGQATNTTLEEELGEYAMQKVLDLFSQELDRAREEGRREYARELLDDYYQPDSDSIEIDVSEIQSELSKLTTK
jgi:dihydroorotase-like cyclic amidohydrolase